MSQPQPQEILCPYCRGGNSAQAAHCQWCGRSFAAPKDTSKHWAWIIPVTVGLGTLAVVVAFAMLVIFLRAR